MLSIFGCRYISYLWNRPHTKICFSLKMKIGEFEYLSQVQDSNFDFLQCQFFYLPSWVTSQSLQPLASPKSTANLRLAKAGSLIAPSIRMDQSLGIWTIQFATGNVMATSLFLYYVLLDISTRLSSSHVFPSTIGFGNLDAIRNSWLTIMHLPPVLPVDPVLLVLPVAQVQPAAVD